MRNRIRLFTSWLERHFRGALVTAFALGIVAVLLSTFTLITRTQVANDKAEQALQASRDDNVDLCRALRIAGNPPPGQGPTNTYGVRVMEALRAAAASPDCPDVP